MGSPQIAYRCGLKRRQPRPRRRSGQGAGEGATTTGRRRGRAGRRGPAPLPRPSCKVWPGRRTRGPRAEPGGPRRSRAAADSKAGRALAAPPPERTGRDREGAKAEARRSGPPEGQAPRLGPCVQDPGDKQGHGQGAVCRGEGRRLGGLRAGWSGSGAGYLCEPPRSQGDGEAFLGMRHEACRQALSSTCHSECVSG